MACDSIPWGAYYAAAAFTEAVSKYCVNCPSEMTVEAEFWNQDNKSRISSGVYRGMRNGVFSAPKFRSFTEAFSQP